MVRTLLILCLFAANAARADCAGDDLIAALPEAQRAELRAAAARQPFHQGLLWRAEKDGRAIHLVGTLHLPDSRHQATLDRIAPLIEAADTVFLEIAPGDEKRLQAMIAETPALAFITEGATLPELLPEDDWQRLRAMMADRGVPGFMVAKMKPWMAMTTLGIAGCAMQALREGRRGLDQMVMDRAEASGKTPSALEPIDTLFRIFADYSPEEQLEFLRLTLAQLAADPEDQMATLAGAYFREEVWLTWEWSFAQARALMDLSDADWQDEVARAAEALIFRRNRAWMDRILPAAASGEVLIAAGALHLPGGDGLLSLLEREGFEITRLPLVE